MVVAFHPYDTARWNSTSWRDTLLKVAEANDFILLCPDGDSLGIITDSADYAFTTRLIDSVKSWHNIDDDRVYSMGFDMGGKAVYEYGLSNASTFGGFIPVGPSISGMAFVSNVIHNAGKRPFYLVHGSADLPSASFYPAVTALLNNCAILDTLLMPGVGHTIDFPNRDLILGHAYRWVDSVNTNPEKSNFSLIYPSNLLTVLTRGFKEYQHGFGWEKSALTDTCGVLKYVFMLDHVNTSFTNPLIVKPSLQGGLDTTVTLTNAELDSLLAANSVPMNGSMAFDWMVVTDINGKYIDTAKSFRLILTRKDLGFSLVSPSNNTVVTLQNGSNRYFDWGNLNHYSTPYYELLFYDSLGNYTVPLAAIESSAGGTSSSVNPTHEELYYKLMFRSGMKAGDSLLMTWSARAFDSAYSERSKEERNILFIRGNVGFDLFAPPDNSILTSKKNVDYRFSWDSVLLEGVRYEWRFDTAGVNLDTTAGIVLASDGDSLQAQVLITFEILDSIMNLYNVQYTDTFYGQWNCMAYSDSSVEPSLSKRDVIIIRSHPVGIDGTEEVPVSIFPNPADGELIISVPGLDGCGEFSIYSMEGRRLMMRRFCEEDNILEPGLPAGQYFWTLITPGKTHSGKVILK